MYLHFKDKVAWISWKINKVLRFIFAPQQRSDGIVALADVYQYVK